MERLGRQQPPRQGLDFNPSEKKERSRMLSWIFWDRRGKKVSAKVGKRERKKEQGAKAGDPSLVLERTARKKPISSNVGDADEFICNKGCEVPGVAGVEGGGRRRGIYAGI